MEQTYPAGPEATFGILFGCFGILIGLIILAFTVIVFCKIVSKTGYHWALGLIFFIPFGNIVMFLVLAFSKWPIQKELELLKGNQSSGSPSPQDNPPSVRDFRNV